jgi:hypothetical protein
MLRLLSLVFILATAAHAQGVQFVDLIKNPDPQKSVGLTLLVTVFPNAVYACPKGFQMYLKNVRPKEVPKGVPESQWSVFFPAPEGQIITSSQGHEYKGICLKGF